MRDALVKVGLGLATAAYVRDAVTRPYEMAGIARRLARTSGKPMVNLGAGVSGRSVRASLMGPRFWGDANLDDCAPVCSPGPNIVSYSDYYTLPWSDRYFGALFACDVLEHLEHPDVALVEWQRVADYVVVCVPALWRPDKWLARWYVEPDLTRAWPIWARRSRTAILPVSDTRAYSPGRCPTRILPRSPAPPAMPSPPPSPASQPLPPARQADDGTESLPVISTLAVLSGSDSGNT